MSITVKPINATLTKDTDTIGKADPYVIFVLGKEKKKSKACQGAGINPSWDDESLVLNVAKETQLTIEVWDKDTFSPDDLMGSASYCLKNVLSAPNNHFSQYIDLEANGKPAGQILIDIVYNGQPINQQPYQQPYQQGLGQAMPQPKPQPQPQPQPPQQQGGWPQNNQGPTGGQGGFVL